MIKALPQKTSFCIPSPLLSTLIVIANGSNVEISEFSGSILIDTFSPCE